MGHHNGPLRQLSGYGYIIHESHDKMRTGERGGRGWLLVHDAAYPDPNKVLHPILAGYPVMIAMDITPLALIRIMVLLYLG